ncbi:YvrJ family protein [Bacillaceae bacterium W0354]
MDHWVSWIPDVGFPILVTFYLLHRIENRLQELNESIIHLPDRINLS